MFMRDSREGLAFKVEPDILWWSYGLNETPNVCAGNPIDNATVWRNRLAGGDWVIGAQPYGFTLSQQASFLVLRVTSL